MSSGSISHLGDKGLSPAFSSMLGSFGRKPSPALDGSPSLFFFSETEGSFGTLTTCLDDKGSNSQMGGKKVPEEALASSEGWLKGTHFLCQARLVDFFTLGPLC